VIKKIIPYFILSVLLALIISGCSSSSSKAVEEKTLISGNNVIITKDCFGAVSKEAYEKLVDYTSTQNVNAAEQMRQKGMFVVLKSGDSAELEQVALGWVQMKMKTGLHAGRTIYTFREMVKK